MDFSFLFHGGIYQICCLTNKKVSLGESSNCFSRLGRHTDNLENNRHDCYVLQQDFNKYGKKHFTFSILEIGLDYSDRLIRQKEGLCLIQAVPKKFRSNKESFLKNFSSQGVHKKPIFCKL